MRMSRRALGLASLAAALFTMVAQSGVALADDPADDERAMKVRFDQGSRWQVGVGLVGALTRESVAQGDDAQPDTSVELSTQLAGRNAVDLGGEGIRYKIYHVVFDTRLDVPTAAGGYALDVTAYEARFMRWSADSSVLLPASPPARLSFPFGIGFRGQLGHFELGEETKGAEIGVTQVELRLDLWRRRDLRSYAELGAASSYRVDVWTEDPAPRTHHLVAPFTLGTMNLHHESANGHHVVSVAIEGGLLLSAPGKSGLTARAKLGYEGILLALNDWPVSAFAEATAKADELARPVSAARELRFQSGLRLSAPLK